jgi:hypothetical protein
MDNMELYVWIVFLLLYVVSRIMKGIGKKNQPRPTGQPSHDVEEAPRRRKSPFDFEEMMKEFERGMLGGAPESEPEREPQPQRNAPAPTTLPPPPPRVEQYREVAERKTAEMKDKYNKYKGKSLEKLEPLKGIDEYRTKSTIPTPASAVSKPLAGKYAQMLREPDGFKNAIVLSEIINRKYS